VKERVVTLGAALGALALFAAVFLQSGGVTERARDAPRPATDERRADGYHAAFAWLQSEGVRVVSLRERLTTLEMRRDPVAICWW
jgi:enterochelin esterase-like enzyme